MAAFAGLWVGLLTLKKSAEHAARTARSDRSDSSVPTGGGQSDSVGPASGPESDLQQPEDAAAEGIEPEGSDLLARAVRLDADHRAEAGRPVSADRLRHELGVGSERARRLVRELREHAHTNGHPGDEAHQLQLATGRHEH